MPRCPNCGYDLDIPYSSDSSANSTCLLEKYWLPVLPDESKTYIKFNAFKFDEVKPSGFSFDSEAEFRRQTEKK